MSLHFEVDISKVPVEAKLSPLEVLFSESQARFIISLEKENFEKLKEMFKDFAIIEEVKGREMVFKSNGDELIGVSVKEGRKIHGSLLRLLGE